MKLKTVIDRPKKKNRESISVQFEISVPKKTTLELRTSNGEIRVSSIEKAIDTQTSNGKIEITDAMGTVTAHTSNGRVTVKQANAERFDLHTSNGAITCEAITGDMKASTSNGAINVKYASDAAPATKFICLHPTVEFRLPRRKTIRPRSTPPHPTARFIRTFQLPYRGSWEKRSKELSGKAKARSIWKPPMARLTSINREMRPIRCHKKGLSATRVCCDDRWTREDHFG